MMSERDIAELAAILVNEYGGAALRVARARRAQFARDTRSDAFRLWRRIAAATARRLRRRRAAGL